MAAVLGANFYAKLIYFYINNNRTAQVVPALGITTAKSNYFAFRKE